MQFTEGILVVGALLVLRASPNSSVPGFKYIMGPVNRFARQVAKRIAVASKQSRLNGRDRQIWS
jgi:hypothetical protein